MKILFVFVFLFFNTFTSANTQNISNFASWIERSCKPLDKGKLTAFPLFSNSQHNLKKSAMLKFEELPDVNSERWLSINDFDGEIWVDIKGYEGKYQVSNYGRVKTLSHKRWNGKGFAMVSGRILRLELVKSKGGYYQIGFHNKSGVSSKKHFVHRLVACSFLDNTNNLPCVNHKNENSRDNRLCNLEWCTYSYNNSYGTGQTRAQLTRLEHGISKPVGVYDKDGNLLKRYISISQAARAVDVHKKTLIGYIKRKKMFKNGLYYKFI